jgi:hypothetical protein
MLKYLNDDTTLIWANYLHHYLQQSIIIQGHLVVIRSYDVTYSYNHNFIIVNEGTKMDGQQCITQYLLLQILSLKDQLGQNPYSETETFWVLLFVM